MGRGNPHKQFCKVILRKSYLQRLEFELVLFALQTKSSETLAPSKEKDFDKDKLPADGGRTACEGVSGFRV